MFKALLDKLTGKSKSHVFQEFGHKVEDITLAKEGVIQYARWQHPGSDHVLTQEEVDFFKHYIKEGDFVIDIGAHEGDTSILMGLGAGKTGTTLALEPNPHVFPVLVANSKLNTEKTNIIPLNFAATAYDGEFTYGSGDASYGNGGIIGFTANKSRNIRYTFTLQGKNLEQYLQKHYAALLPKLKLIKIDAEGYDKEILKTLPKIIADYRPYVITECFGPATPAEKIELFDTLTQMGYKLFNTNSWALKPTGLLSRLDMTGKKTFDILGIPEELYKA